LDSRVIHGLEGGKDKTEGIRSFLERRPANFKGRFPEDAQGAYP
jgi:hypothetical protein